MKISKAKLKSIILEELQNVMGEMFYDDDTDDDSDWYDDREDEDPVLALVNPVKRYFKPRANARAVSYPIAPIDQEKLKNIEAPLSMDDPKIQRMFTPDQKGEVPTLLDVLKGVAIAADGDDDNDVILTLLKAYYDRITTPQMENKQKKITKARLKTIIMEELASVMREQEFGGETGKSTKIYIPQDVGETSITNLPYDQFDDRGIEFDDAFEEATKEAVDLFLGSYGGELGQDEEGDYITIYNPNPRINYGFKLDKMIKDALLEK